MRKPFEIKFDFPVALSDLKISLTATVEMHNSEPYYEVHDFYFTNSDKSNRHHSVLPRQEIKRIIRDGAYVWVHKDALKESELSLAIGKGIEVAKIDKELNRH